MKRVLLSWSSGKDCAWALHLLRQQPDIEVVGLLTTINAQLDRVAMHGTRRSILEAQAASAGLPLWQIPLPWPCSNEVYDRRMSDACSRAVSEGVTAIAFGDLFLREIRAYREAQLKQTGLEPLFPLWEVPTDELARKMISGGLCAKVVCVDSRQLNPVFAGREYDLQFLADLPSEVDPCGEKGEFHSCVYEGPMFSRAIPLEQGETLNREGFIYSDFDLAASVLAL
jgi:uncharacterized protein (TIGR00290 family)